eukprot:CFRG0117T1
MSHLRCNSSKSVVMSEPQSVEAKNVIQVDSEEEQSDSIEIVKNFHLSWFAMVMGWGGTALALNALPGVSDDVHNVLNIIGTVIWFWDLIYCVIFTFLLCARIIKYPLAYWEMMKKPVEFLFYGCFPMGVAVVGMGFVFFAPNIMAKSAAYEIAYVLFYFDVAITIIAMTLPPFMMIVYQSHSPDSMKSLWLLPFVSCVVAAAQAGVVGPFQKDLGRQQDILFAGLMLWGAGHFCSNGILESCACTAPLTSLSVFGYILPGLCLLIGTVMWGVGVWWLFISAVGTMYHASTIAIVSEKIVSQKKMRLDQMVISTGDWLESIPASGVSTKHSRRDRKLPFNLGWWGVVFPFVTLIMGTAQLYVNTEFSFFMWMGRIFTGILTCISFYVHFKTICRVRTREFWLKFA